MSWRQGIGQEQGELAVWDWSGDRLLSRSPPSNTEEDV